MNIEKIDAAKLYALADDYTNKVKLENVKFGKKLGEDYRQNLVSQVCFNLKRYDSTKGTLQEYINFIFDMVTSAHHLPYSNIIHKAPVYENPMENFKNVGYKEFSGIAKEVQLSPFAYGKLIGIPVKDTSELVGIPENYTPNIINSDNFKLSMVKVSAPLVK